MNFQRSSFRRDNIDKEKGPARKNERLEARRRDPAVAKERNGEEREDVGLF